MKAAISVGTVLALALAVRAQAEHYLGCYASPGNLTNQGPNVYQSVGLCAQLCAQDAAPFAAVQAADCWCGAAPPAPASVVAHTQCNTNCPGYPIDTCGGHNVWSVYQLGILADPDEGGQGDGPPPGTGGGGGPNNGGGDGPGNGDGPGPGNGPTTTASSFTVYPTPTVTSATVSQPASWASASTSVSAAVASPSTATSGASRGVRFLFF
ncbi:WSC-domain-containing protein [Aspergillus ibericus CBS 121593]|uniref:WSC-domain-containing protein n=1 Tax=Aspergillus ibericus CBS 121593 TaxID=1448316 RepID=A0A395H6V5_9EURO|nr:WSC-domain-containing protein [Aspergillus ibericus CBS 121593]RAL03356.1 WSC-domain-containing protein [Aspergillus ibericus CBS 121593]